MTRLHHCQTQANGWVINATTESDPQTTRSGSFVARGTSSMIVCSHVPVHTMPPHNQQFAVWGPFRILRIVAWGGDSDQGGAPPLPGGGETELRNVAAYAYQDGHVWSACFDLRAPPPPGPRRNQICVSGKSFGSPPLGLGPFPSLRFPLLEACLGMWVGCISR